MNKKRGPQGLILLAKRSLTPFFWMPMLSLVTLGILLVLANNSASANLPQHTETITSGSAPLVIDKSPKAQQTSQTVTPSNTPPHSMSQPVAAISHSSYCTIAAFGAPSAIVALSSSVGVTVVTDPPVYYTFRGGVTNSSTIAAATTCARQQPALGGKYHGLTARTIKYAYDITPINDTTCRVDAVRVTLHQAMLLPRADMEGLPAGTVSQWQVTVGKLQAHEYEHVSINQTAVQQIYDQLTGFNGPCANIDSLASAVAEQNIANMNRANQTLDVHTNHGTL